jgi:pimeloyl-ACP methyl ester carboxylesterase
MPIVDIDGIATRYETVGSGPALLMFSPGGFDATLEKWSTLGAYARTRPMDHLPAKFTCIVFDRRECGQSGGRVEKVTWSHYVAQGLGLLDHLRIERAHFMGGCMGCSPVIAAAAAHPARVASMVLYWPVGGAKYRIKGQARFQEHLDYLDVHELAQVVALARTERKSFGADPRGGPWATPIQRDGEFAAQFAALDKGRYRELVAATAAALLDRDTAPGAEPEELLQLRIPALVIPGHDESHATSAARYLEECIPGAQYWDMPVDGQTEQTAPARILQFLDGANP